MRPGHVARVRRRAQRGRRVRGGLERGLLPAGDICVNSTLLQCPEHSTSLAGSDEGADCKCNGGYFNMVRTTAPTID